MLRADGGALTQACWALVYVQGLPSYQSIYLGNDLHYSRHLELLQNWLKSVE